MAKEVITELEVLFTANTQQVDKAAKDVQDRAQKIEKNPVNQKVDGNAKGALDAMDRVEAEAKKIVSAKTMATVDANIDRAETSLSKVQERLDYLRSVEGTMEVTADIKKAEAALSQITRRRDALVAARESMVVDADTSPAEAALKDLPKIAETEGEQAGKRGGRSLTDNLDGATRGAGDAVGKAVGGELGDSLEAALTAIPVAGGILLAAGAIGKAITSAISDGLQVEVRSDRLMAQTGLDPVAIGKLARAAGEAYAGNWGESIEANMDTARVAIQQGLLDPKATARDSQSIIASLSGVADILGQDIPSISRATTTLLRTGLAKDAAGAFDIIVKGFQAGNDMADDWLDTLTEYPALFQRLGISGAEATGLVNQGLKAGARNGDLVADALKEFQIRATDASDASAEGYRLIGLSAEKMTKQIAAGGQGARDGLDLVLDRLRATEDPVKRNAAAVALFGTQAEDLGAALFSLDLSNAVEQLGSVEGAAKSAMDALSDNAANDIATAQRNIEVAADGIKGALAAAFNPQIEDFATFVSSNREAVVQFLLDIANGGLNAARTLINAAADGTEAFGDFVGSAGPAVLGFIQSVIEGIDSIPFVDLGDAVEDFKAMREEAEKSFASFDASTEDAADAIRTNLIKNGIDPAQEKLNALGDQQLTAAALNDATVRMAASIDAVGFAADGTRLQFTLLGDRIDVSTEQGKTLEGQIRQTVAALDEQARAGAAAGDSQEDLTARYNEGREALIRQLEQMGLTRDQAERLAAAYVAIPGRVDTVVAANTREAQAAVDGFFVANNGRRINVYVDANGGKTYQVAGTGVKFNAAGGVLTPMAAGGIPGTPLDPVAQMVPPGTLRVVGDRMDVDEAYVPLDGSARSWAILREALRRMPGGMADGGVTADAPARAATGPMVQVLVDRVIEGTPSDIGDEVGWAMTRAGLR